MQELLFSRKKSNITHPIIYSNNVQEQRTNQQKHFSIILDGKLNFKCHIDKVLMKTFYRHKKTSTILTK